MESFEQSRAARSRAQHKTAARNIKGGAVGFAVGAFVFFFNGGMASPVWAGLAGAVAAGIAGALAHLLLA